MRIRHSAVLLLLAVIIFSLATPAVTAEDVTRFEAGGFFDYFRIGQPDPAINKIGFGGRFALRVHKSTQIEAEFAYDPGSNFTSQWTAGAASLPVTTKLRTFDALFGPKFNFGSDPLRPYFTIKAGWVDFNAFTSTFPTNFESGLGKLTSSGSAAAVYPAGGVPYFRGRWGIRGELGDLFYYDSSGHNNFRATVGIQFRF